MVGSLVAPQQYAHVSYYCFIIMTHYLTFCFVSQANLIWFEIIKQLQCTPNYTVVRRAWPPINAGHPNAMKGLVCMNWTLCLCEIFCPVLLEFLLIKGTSKIVHACFWLYAVYMSWCNTVIRKRWRQHIEVLHQLQFVVCCSMLPRSSQHFILHWYCMYIKGLHNCWSIG